MRYFSLGRKDAALLGPIMDPNIPPLEAGGISYSKNQKYILFWQELFKSYESDALYNERKPYARVLLIAQYEPL